MDREFEDGRSIFVLLRRGSPAPDSEKSVMFPSTLLWPPFPSGRAIFASPSFSFLSGFFRPLRAKAPSSRHHCTQEGTRAGDPPFG
jgi:hypothetical protein